MSELWEITVHVQGTFKLPTLDRVERWLAIEVGTQLTWATQSVKSQGGT